MRYKAGLQFVTGSISLRYQESLWVHSEPNFYLFHSTKFIIPPVPPPPTHPPRHFCPDLYLREKTIGSNSNQNQWQVKIKASRCTRRRRAMVAIRGRGRRSLGTFYGQQHGHLQSAMLVHQAQFRGLYYFQKKIYKYCYLRLDFFLNWCKVVFFYYKKGQFFFL